MVFLVFIKLYLIFLYLVSLLGCDGRNQLYRLKMFSFNFYIKLFYIYFVIYNKREQEEPYTLLGETNIQIFF